MKHRKEPRELDDIVYVVLLELFNEHSVHHVTPRQAAHVPLVTMYDV